MNDDLKSAIHYLEQVKKGKINIITKINIYIKGNNNDEDTKSYNNKYQMSLDQSSKSQTNKALLKRPGTVNEKRLAYIYENSNINTLFKKNNNSNINTNNNTIKNSNNKKSGNSGFKILKEKDIQESGSADLELDETIKNL